MYISRTFLCISVQDFYVLHFYNKMAEEKGEHGDWVVKFILSFLFCTSKRLPNKYKLRKSFYNFSKILNAAPTVMIYRQPVSYPELARIRNGQVPLRNFSI